MTIGHDPDHPTTCPFGGLLPGSGDVEPPTIALVDVAAGGRAHVDRIPERLGAADGLLDELARDGLVRGLTITVLDHRNDDAVLVRTGRADMWIDADVAEHVLVRLGDLSSIADELCRGSSTSSVGDPADARRHR